MKKITGIAVLFAMVSVAAFAAGRGDDQAAIDRYPSRPVVATVAWPAGSGADLVFRAIAEVFPDHSGGQPFVIDNRPCAAGGVAGVVDFMMNAAPDGYRVLQWMIAHVIRAHWTNVPFEGNSFEPVAQIMASHNYIAVAGDSRWQSLQELIAYARANPGQLTVGNAGPGGGNHMSGVMLERAAGVQFLHIPFPGGPQSITGLLTGDNQASMNIPPEGIAQAHAGQIRILATLSPERFADFPDVPTAREAGVDVVFEQWRGIVVPRGTPPGIVERLQEIIRRSVEDPRYAYRLEGMMAQPLFTDARTFGALIESENSRIEDTIRSAGLGDRHR